MKPTIVRIEEAVSVILLMASAIILTLFEIIPIINLHKRFRLKRIEHTEDENIDDFDGGFIILNIDGLKIGIIIDKVARVISVNKDEVKPPPQMISGIGTEYIHGVVRQDQGYLIILDIRRIFNPKEMQKIIDIE